MQVISDDSLLQLGLSGSLKRQPSSLTIPNSLISHNHSVTLFIHHSLPTEAYSDSDNSFICGNKITPHIKNGQSTSLSSHLSR